MPPQRRILLMAGIILILMVNPVQADIVADLLAYYPLDGNALDASGNGNHGTVDPLHPEYHPTYEPGYLSQAARFDGINDYIDLADWNISGSSMTLAAWIKPLALGTDPRIISKAQGTNQGQITWLIGIDDGANKPMFRLRTNSTDYTEIQTTNGIGSGPWPWIHIAATYNGTTMNLYVNGILDGSGSQSNDIGNDGRVIWIGGNPLDPTIRPFNGLIDEVRIYSRALSPSEIVELMNFTSVSHSSPLALSILLVLFMLIAVSFLIRKHILT